MGGCLSDANNEDCKIYNKDINEKQHFNKKHEYMKKHKSISRYVIFLDDCKTVNHIDTTGEVLFVKSVSPPQSVLIADYQTV